MLRPLRYGGRRFHSSVQGERAMIALGANIGNRAKTIQDALDALGTFAKVLRTSFLYESPPMYVTDQPAFLNAACEVETELDPLNLLRATKRVEKNLGRDQQEMRNGPRRIDLDIITYGERTVNLPDPVLQIPHPRLHEREFVLRPVCDISPNLQIPQNDGQLVAASDILRRLVSQEGEAGLLKVTPTHTGRLLRWGKRALLMGIINTTPDSFSDGGRHNTVDTALAQAKKFASYGFDVIDIGGQSTRPGAELLPPDTELSRTLPITRVIRDAFPSMLISADTFYSSVAQALLEAGADMVNDVSGGVLDEKMHSALASARAAVVVMHMRGTPATMQRMTQYNNPLISAVGNELHSRLEAAQRAGIRRWSIIADAGIGFAKTGAQGAHLAGRSREFQSFVGGYPILLGLSRKSFLRFAAKDVERDWATAGAVGAAVGRGGVDMVRVHLAEMGDVVRGADIIGRS